MQKTTNYQLPKWEKTDRILMDDFNGLTGTLDTALKANADAVTAETIARENAMTAEAAARENADTALGTRITNEAAARTDADTAERTSCSAALSAETTARINAVAAEAAERANADAALQSAVNTAQATANAAQAAVAGMTCITSYVGNGTVGVSAPVTLNFAAPPKLVIVLDTENELKRVTFFLRGVGVGLTVYGSSNSNAGFHYLPTIWSGSSLSYYSAVAAASHQLNESGRTYHVFALA